MGALSAKDPSASVIGGVADIATIQLRMDAALARQDTTEGTASAVMGALLAKDPSASVIGSVGDIATTQSAMGAALAGRSTTKGTGSAVMGGSSGSGPLVDADNNIVRAVL